MRVIARRVLRDYSAKEPAAATELNTWFAEAKQAEWKTPADIKAKYGSASILKEGRVVFNICGNNYRLVAKINYAYGIVFIRFIGTHKDYDAINAETI
jgi:mRNA interferase HigB